MGGNHVRQAELSLDDLALSERRMRRPLAAALGRQSIAPGQAHRGPVIAAGFTIHDPDVVFTDLGLALLGA
jgi:hypothetical protein